MDVAGAVFGDGAGVLGAGGGFLGDYGVVNFFGRVGVAQGVAERFDGHEPRDTSQGLNVGAGLVGRRGQQDDEVDRPAVDGFKVDGFGGFADGDHEVVNARA